MKFSSAPWLSVFALVGGCLDDGGPRLDSVTPATAKRGAMVTIEGARFCSGGCATTTGEVLLGLALPQIRANVLAYADTMATIAIPSIAPLGATELVLVVDGTSSNALAFEVTP
ncbi:MAG: hypothetical protein NT062_09240 [Proteobacteria bacterium]|nr:hypothetical protein [Pseudomonadota bacterium]